MAWLCLKTNAVSHGPLKTKETLLSSLKMVGFLDGSVVKNPPVMQESQEMWVRFLGWKDCLEEEMSTHSTLLAWKKWTEEPGRLQSLGSLRVGHD